MVEVLDVLDSGFILLFVISIFYQKDDSFYLTLIFNSKSYYISDTTNDMN